MPSKASILGHPIHPFLVFYPIAFFTGAFVMDIAYEVGVAGADYIQYAYILIIAGIATTLLAAIPGLIDYNTISDEDAARVATSHVICNTVMLILESVNLGFRAMRKGHYWHDGWIMSLLAVSLLSFSTWLGHDIVYNHGMAVKDSYPSRRRGGRDFY